MHLQVLQTCHPFHDFFSFSDCSRGGLQEIEIPIERCIAQAEICK